MVDRFIEQLRLADTTTQAMGITVAGLYGVFLTLGIFFLIIFIADKVGGRGKKR